MPVMWSQSVWQTGQIHKHWELSSGNGCCKEGKFMWRKMAKTSLSPFEFFLRWLERKLFLGKNIFPSPLCQVLNPSQWPEWDRPAFEKHPGHSQCSCDCSARGMDSVRAGGCSHPLVLCPSYKGSPWQRWDTDGKGGIIEFAKLACPGDTPDWCTPTFKTDVQSSFYIKQFSAVLVAITHAARSAVHVPGKSFTDYFKHYWARCCQ